MRVYRWVSRKFVPGEPAIDLASFVPPHHEVKRIQVRRHGDEFVMVAFTETRNDIRVYDE
jgi:hypothetical protein